MRIGLCSIAAAGSFTVHAGEPFSCSPKLSWGWRQKQLEEVRDKAKATIDAVRMRIELLAAKVQFHHGAVVVQRSGTAEGTHVCEDALKGLIAARGLLQALIAEHVTFSVLGFGDAIRHHKEVVARLQLAGSALIGCGRDQANW